MLAREYFEGIRAERVKIAKTEEMLNRMKSREAAKAQSYEIGRGSGGMSISDAIDRRIDMEGRLKKRAANLKKDIDDALTVLYGKDNGGGLAKLKGSRYADAICMGYLQAQPWPEIADIMQCSQQWCHELCNAGFVYIDKVGWAHVKNA